MFFKSINYSLIFFLCIMLLIFISGCDKNTFQTTGNVIKMEDGLKIAVHVMDCDFKFPFYKIMMIKRPIPHNASIPLKILHNIWNNSDVYVIKVLDNP